MPHRHMAKLVHCLVSWQCAVCHWVQD